MFGADYILNLFQTLTTVEQALTLHVEASSQKNCTVYSQHASNNQLLYTDDPQLITRDYLLTTIY